MRISDAGLNLIKSSEGFVNHVYNDNGAPAIGYGHRILPGETFPDFISESEASTILSTDLQTRFEPVVNSLVPPSCTQGQFDALCSFCFNLGPQNLKTMLDHGWDQVPDQMLRWDKVNDKQSLGLAARRQNEVNLFLSA